KDRVIFGNAVTAIADIAILAAIGPRHAAIVRSTSFHGGVAYDVEALDGRPVAIRGKVIDRQRLVDGDVVSLGRDFEFTFRLPSERSRAALLQLPSAHGVDGVHRIVLLPPTGRAGALLIGPSETCHVSTPGTQGECEIAREPESAGGDLIAQGPGGVAVDGDAARGKAPCLDGSVLAADDLRAAIRNAAPRG
ncbi:MAG: hypothetical protein KDB53_10230, partial [Planctomycetes bacterium]|nr:hypothetical protein [Planctomycetota bacterium]